MRTREEYENLINKSSFLERDNITAAVTYKAERYAFLTELADYYRFYVYPNRPLENYSMTLIETAVECIKYYDKSKGLFLHLFNKLMKRNLLIERAKEKIDEQRKGIKLAERESMLIRKIIAFANSKNLDLTDASVQEKIAIALGLSLDAVIKLLYINFNATVVSSTVNNDDGDEIELYDFIADGLDDRILSESGLCETLDKIDRVFTSIQERQKRIISMMLTVEIIKVLDGNVRLSVKLLKGRALFSQDTIELFKLNKKLPSARDISALCGVSEQSASRTYKNFKEKIRQKC